MRITLVALSLLFANILCAQNIENLIPSNSVCVAQINGDQIFKLISQSDISEMVNSSGMQSKGEMQDLANFGFDINSKAYYFFNVIDSVSYHNVILAVNDKNKVASTLSEMSPTEPTTENGFSVLRESSKTAAWNDKIAIFFSAEIPKDEVTMEDLILEWEKEIESIDENEEFEGEYPEMPTESDVRMKNYFAPLKYSEDEIASMMQMHMTSILNSSSSSIASNKSFQSGKIKNSSAYFWVNNVNDIVNGFAQNPMMKNLAIPMSDQMNTGVNSVAMNMIFDEDEIRLASSFTIDNQFVKPYKEMYDSKLDKSFLKYFDESDVLAYISTSVNTQKALEQYPNIVNLMYGGMFPQFKEEIEIGTDLFSIILDEEEIGKLITGDALLILHDLHEQEVSYTDYRYDEDFNMIEFDTTKMEQIPNFTVMMGSENEKLLNKIMKLGLKHQLATLDNAHYTLATKALGAPFDLYAVVNDDIVFVTNSVERINSYTKGNKSCKLGIHKKPLKNNIFNAYLDLSKTVDLASPMIPTSDNFVNYLRDNYKSFWLTSSKIKDNKMNLDMTIKTSGQKGNSLKLLLSSYDEYIQELKKAKEDQL